MNKCFGRTITIIITLCVIFILESSEIMIAAAQSEYLISSLNGKYKTQGRTQVSDDGVCLEWSASGIEFQAECSGDVSITVDDVKFAWNNPINMPTETRGSDTGGLYFTVVIDGKMQYESKRIPSNNNGTDWKSNLEYPFHITKAEKTEFVIAKNLQKGVHTISIYKQDEASDGNFKIKSISLNGKILPAISQKSKYIEFVGDSITAGHGNLVNGGDADAPLYKDATRGWAYLTAQNLNADWSVVATSGITTVAMLKQYLYSDSSGKIKYSFERKPDVIVVGLGTNDIWTRGNKTDDEIQECFRLFLNEIRNNNPKSKIIWIYGMMTSSANRLIEESINKMGGKANGCYTLQLPQDLSGGKKHPGISVQHQYADIVSECINNVLNQSNNSGSNESNAADRGNTPTDSVNNASNIANGSAQGSKVSETPSETSGFYDSKTYDSQDTSSESSLNEETVKNDDAATSGNFKNDEKRKLRNRILISVTSILFVGLAAFGISLFFLKKKMS